MKEIWKPIKNFEGFYEVSSFGRIRSIDRYVLYSNNKKYFHKGKILKSSYTNRYEHVSLQKERKRITKLVHRLVAEAFILNKNKYPQINHIDGNRRNNNYFNLEWTTQSENMKHAYRIGLQNQVKRSKRVAQLSLDGDIIRIFDSTIQASKETGIERSWIRRICQGKLNRSYNYKWKFI